MGYNTTSRHGMISVAMNVFFKGRFIGWWGFVRTWIGAVIIWGIVGLIVGLGR